MASVKYVSQEGLLAGATAIPDVPDAPTIGALTDLGTGSSISIAYTAATTGGAVTTFTATSTPGGITATGSSPITVTGLSSETYTFKVKGTNATATGPESSASTSVTLVTPKSVVTGGTLSSDATYYYRTFIANGTLGISTVSLSCDVLVVAGGGGGGLSGGSGGGGAGGLVYLSSQSLTPANYNAVIGAGGSTDANGGNSQFGSLTAAVGGGRGGRDGTANDNGASGGSGGGGSIDSTDRASGTAGQGNQGGLGKRGSNNILSGGGGGGAGAAGVDAGNSLDTPGNGGNGINTYSSWATATGTGDGGYYAGGGAGLGWTATGTAVGGFGGGGDYTSGVAMVNTGGGGLGYYAGGSGIVIVRYLKTAVA